MVEPEPEPLQFTNTATSTSTVAKLPIHTNGGKDLNLICNKRAMVGLNCERREGLALAPRRGTGALIAILGRIADSVKLRDRAIPNAQVLID
jgi:hypothetical protein